MRLPILVIMAAGMGSRYGGLKQIDPITEEGDIIIDFSIYDAIRAGFKKVVLIIKEEHEQEFEDAIGSRLSKYIDVVYVHQKLDTLPQGYSVPESRIKPWGTTHAIWCCKDVIDSPFVIINADDYYGPSAFKYMYNHLCEVQEKGISEYAMVGYRLNNTLTDNGPVTRGICRVENNNLVEIIECKKIERREGRVVSYTGDEYVQVLPESLVSMNIWGFTPDIFSMLESDFINFLENEVSTDSDKSECLIPTTIGHLIDSGEVEVKVYQSNDVWQGITYQEDKPRVTSELVSLKEEGLYPKYLWK